MSTKFEDAVAAWVAYYDRMEAIDRAHLHYPANEGRRSVIPYMGYSRSAQSQRRNEQRNEAKSILGMARHISGAEFGEAKRCAAILHEKNLKSCCCKLCANARGDDKEDPVQE